MKISAYIFLISGLAYLALSISLVISQELNIGSLLMAIFSAALVYQGFELLKNKSGARWRAISSSTVIAVCSGTIAYIIFSYQPEQVFLEVFSYAWPVLGSAITVSVLFLLVSILLIVSKPNIPNKALQPMQKPRG